MSIKQRLIIIPELCMSVSKDIQLAKIMRDIEQFADSDSDESETESKYGLAHVLSYVDEFKSLPKPILIVSYQRILTKYNESTKLLNNQELIGCKLEARDRLNPSFLCVATIGKRDLIWAVYFGSKFILNKDEVRENGEVLIHFDGWTKKYGKLRN